MESTDTDPTLYADNAELRVLAAAARTNGTLSPRLAELLYRIIDGFLFRFGVMIPESDREDFRQDAIMHLAERAIPRIFERGGNPFAYFTQAIKNFARDFRKDEQNRIAEAAEFARAAAENGNLSHVDRPELYRPAAKTRPRKRAKRNARKTGVPQRCR